MNKLKTSWIMWGMIMVTIVALLFIYGIILQKENKPYKGMEKKITNSAQKYVEANMWYPNEGEELKIQLSELLESKMLESGELIKDSCDGYVIVKNEGVIEYKTYIKCINYTTHGFKQK